jgi:hypothetical protein
MYICSLLAKVFGFVQLSAWFETRQRRVASDGIVFNQETSCFDFRVKTRVCNYAAFLTGKHFFL